MNIDDAILAEIRALASSSNRPFQEVFTETLQRGLAGSSGRRNRVTIQPVAVKIGSASFDMSMNRLYDQLEAEQHQP